MTIRYFLVFALVLSACSTSSTVRDSHDTHCAPAAYATLPPHKGGGLKHDPQEDDPKLRPAFEEAHAYAERRMSKEPHRFGEVHECWRLQQEYLLEKFGIRWKTPAEMNPTVAFD
jgi:hypothetical protein